MPLNVQLSRSGRLLAVTNNGQSKQSIQLIDPRTGKLLDEAYSRKSWYGLKFSVDGRRLYASGGNDNTVLAYGIANQKLAPADTLRLGAAWPKEKISPTGLDVDDAQRRLYVVTKEDNSLYVLDLATKVTVSKLALGHEAYGCLLNPDGKTLYISLWGGHTLFNALLDALKTKVPQGGQLVLQRAGRVSQRPHPARPRRACWPA